MASGQYKIKEYPDGTVSAITCVSWDRKHGKCNVRTYYKQGEIFTQSRLRSWCRKYNVELKDEDIQRLPRAVWWQE